MDYELTSAFTGLLLATCGFWVIVVVVMMIVFALSRFLNRVVTQSFYEEGDE